MNKNGQTNSMAFAAAKRLKLKQNIKSYKKEESSLNLRVRRASPAQRRKRNLHRASFAAQEEVKKSNKPVKKRFGTAREARGKKEGSERKFALERTHSLIYFNSNDLYGHSFVFLSRM